MTDKPDITGHCPGLSPDRTGHTPFRGVRVCPASGTNDGFLIGYREPWLGRAVR